VLQAHAGAIPLGTVQRCQLLSEFASMLPESARLAHGKALLQRRHERQMPAHILKQVSSLAHIIKPGEHFGLHSKADEHHILFNQATYSVNRMVHHH
jgi:hypothetical protein